MRAVVQRARRGKVTVEDRVAGEIGVGLVVLIGVKDGDGAADAEYIADKLVNLRIFEDEEGKMNRSVSDLGGQVLAISQFTLYGDVRKGRRPSFTGAAPPEEGLAWFNRTLEEIRKRGIAVDTGEFGEHMVVEIINDGPVTIILDSQRVV
ncbi:MAG: D-aminoacyl-tRNA deacylase [Candidatus Saccharibacteria bacterium]